MDLSRVIFYSLKRNSSSDDHIRLVVVHQSVRAMKEKGLQAWVRREVEWPNPIKNPSSIPSSQRRPELIGQKTRECTTSFLCTRSRAFCVNAAIQSIRAKTISSELMIMMQGTNTDKNPEMITSSMCDQ